MPGGVMLQIGTRNANTVLRLHDGETQVLAGLIKHKMFPELWTVRTDLTELAKESDPT